MKFLYLNTHSHITPNLYSDCVFQEQKQIKNPPPKNYTLYSKSSKNYTYVLCEKQAEFSYQISQSWNILNLLQQLL